MKFSVKAAALLLATVSSPALAEATPAPRASTATKVFSVPDPSARDAYRAIFAAIDSGRWADAASQLDAMPEGVLHPLARAELYTAKDSPRVELEPLLAVLTRAPELPMAAQLQRMAAKRGAVDLPALPPEQKLLWLGSAPRRARAESVTADPVAADLGAKILPLIKADDPMGCEALIVEREPLLTPSALTEWRQRVAWSYYLTGDTGNARRLAGLAQSGEGEWRVQADWVAGLAAWRQHDYAAAGKAFELVAARGEDSEMRAAGQYWAARADMASGRPQQVQARLRVAAKNPETFYGMLAAQALGIVTPQSAAMSTSDLPRVSALPNIRRAFALDEIGKPALAAELIKHQAKIGSSRDHPALIDLAARLNMPDVQLWLAHNGPAGARPAPASRYPTPRWTPDRGWRVDQSLVFAHTLQESNFRPAVVSPAGAQGLMQVRPGTAGDIARARGQFFDRSQLSQPTHNLEYGQSFLEGLRDSGATGGLLPKVIAAYNAGPVPIERWNSTIQDRGDPLLYIESIPYWETRGYVSVVMRNYWMYQRNAGKPSTSLKAMAQGMWPRFPGLAGAPSVRIEPGKSTRIASAR